MFLGRLLIQVAIKVACPGGSVDKNLPANAGGHGFDPWFGKIPRAKEQLSPCAVTTEPEL